MSGGEWLTATTVTGLIGAAGVWVLQRGLEDLREARAFEAGSHTTSGTVARLQPVDDPDSAALAPVVEFDVDGNRHTFRSRHGTYPATHREGDTVPVRFDPRDPRKAEIDSWWSLYGFAAIACGLGGLSTLVGAGGVLALTWRFLAAP
jgi:hypothetical protein